MATLERPNTGGVTAQKDYIRETETKIVRGGVDNEGGRKWGGQTRKRVSDSQSPSEKVRASPVTNIAPRCSTVKAR